MSLCLYADVLYDVIIAVVGLVLMDSAIRRRPSIPFFSLFVFLHSIYIFAISCFVVRFGIADPSCAM
jgi:hypothetical protein